MSSKTVELEAEEEVEIDYDNLPGSTREKLEFLKCEGIDDWIDDPGMVQMMMSC